MPYPIQKRHRVATMLPCESLSVAAVPVFGLDVPSALELALTAQYLAANDLVDWSLLDFVLEVDLLLDLLLAVPVLLVVGLALAPLRLLFQVQVVELPALLPVRANWEVPVLQADLVHVILVDELAGERHLLLDLQQYATEMTVPDFRFWCPEFLSQEFVVIALTTRQSEHVTRPANL